MRWGRANTPNRRQQIIRSLAKITVKVGPRKRVKVDPGVAEKLSAFHERASQRVLAWGARQAMLLAESGVSTLDSDKPLADQFVLGFEGVLDYAEVALVLAPDGKRATRVNLLSMSGQEAWEAQLRYHALLAAVDDEGELQIPKGWTAYQTAAAIGVSPGMLRQVNKRGVEKRRYPSKIWVTHPAPLEHRYSLVEYDDGHAWVWIPPGIDKDRVGRNIGLCINSGGWDRRLQFALVDSENRPWGVLTMNPKHADGRGVGDPNELVIVEPDVMGSKTGVAHLDVAALMRRQILLAWGECKGRFNKRPIPDPHRRYAVALMTSGLLGPVNVASRDTAAADLAATLLVGLTPGKARRLWKAAGGEASVFSLADALMPTVMGDGGPTEKTIDYFDAAPPEQWLRTGLAPLLLAASTDDELQLIWRQHAGRSPEDQALRSEIMRIVERRKIFEKVFWKTQIIRAERTGSAFVPPATKRSVRQRLAQAEDWNKSLRARAYQRLVRKIVGGNIESALAGELVDPKTKEKLTVFDVFVAMLDRGDKRLLKSSVLMGLFRFREGLTRPALAVCWWRYEQLELYGSPKAVNEARNLSIDKSVTKKYVVTVLDRLVKVSGEIVHRDLLPHELEELREYVDPDNEFEHDGVWEHPDYPPNLLSLIMGSDEGWHCAACFDMDEDSASGIATLYPDWGWSWQWMHNLLEHEAIAELLGIESNRGDGPLYQIMDTLEPDTLVGQWDGVPSILYLALLMKPENQDQHLGPIWQQWVPVLGYRLQWSLDRLIRDAAAIGKDDALLPPEKMNAVWDLARKLGNPLQVAVGEPENPKLPPAAAWSAELDQLGVPTDWP